MFRENVHGAQALWAAPTGAEYGLLDSVRPALWHISEGRS